MYSKSREMSANSGVISKNTSLFAFKSYKTKYRGSMGGDIEEVKALEQGFLEEEPIEESKATEVSVPDDVLDARVSL